MFDIAPHSLKIALNLIGVIGPTFGCFASEDICGFWLLETGKTINTQIYPLAALLPQIVMFVSFEFSVW
jgi:hypothetical protein